MRRRLSALAFIAAMLIAPAAYPDTYQCDRPDLLRCCQWNGSCEGDFYSESTPCKVVCYVIVEGHEIQQAGSAECGVSVLCPP